MQQSAAAIASRLRNGLSLALLGLSLWVGARGGSALWRHLEPAHSRPLLPPAPWRAPAPLPQASPAPLQQLSPGWRARSLGNPAAGPYPHCWQSLPRTPWDLTVFDGRLLVGLGNAANDGPTANAGPVPLFAYGLEQNRWQQEATLPEEELPRFLAHGDTLWIPGADARGSWRWGNLYRRRSGGGWWWQERRLPRFIHVHDLAVHQGRLVVAGNVPDAVASGPQQQRHGSALAVSTDGGSSWRVERLPGWRATALLPVEGQLYAVEAMPGPALRRWLEAGGRWHRFVAVRQWQARGAWLPRPDLTPAALLPGVAGAGERYGWIGQATPSGPAVAWITSLGPWRQDPAQRSAFVAQRLRAGAITVQPIRLEPGSQAMDLLAATATTPAPAGREPGPQWWLLSSRQLASGRWRSQISRVITLGPTLRQEAGPSFEAPLPAWSLAGDGHRWFVGLGHPPSQNEPTPERCDATAALSGTVVELRRRP